MNLDNSDHTAYWATPKAYPMSRGFILSPPPVIHSRTHLRIAFLRCYACPALIDAVSLTNRFVVVFQSPAADYLWDKQRPVQFHMEAEAHAASTLSELGHTLVTYRAFLNGRIIFEATM